MGKSSGIFKVGAELFLTKVAAISMKYLAALGGIKFTDSLMSGQYR